MAQLELDAVRAALDAARRSGYAEVELGVAEERFRAVLGPRPKRSPEAVTAAPTPQERFLTATMVGYLREPVAPGTAVGPGKPAGVMEALGIPNPLEPLEDGVVEEWLVPDGAPVAYGQRVARMVPA